MQRPLHTYSLAGCLVFTLSSAATAQLRAGWRQKLTSSSPVLTAPKMAFDRVRSEVVLVGDTISGDLETWVWDGTTWTRRCTSFATVVCGMSHRSSFTLSYDASCQEVLLFGGYDSPTQAWFNEVWSWNGTTWTLKVGALAPGAPQGVSGSAACFDEGRSEHVFYGGGTAPSTGGALQSATWRLTSCAAWGSAVSGPAARQLHGLSYDATRLRVVLFGGEVSGPTSTIAHNDTHEWDGTSWQQLSPGSRPQARYFHGQAYDRMRQRTVVFGGFEGQIAFGDTWEWEGVNWVQPSLGSQSPSPRHAMAMCYDEVRHCVVLYGGSTPTGGWYTDTWVYTPLAEYDVTGTGCLGSNGVPAIVPVPFGLGPRVGQPFTIQFVQLPVSPTFVLGILGFTEANLPLGFLGMPGCTLLVSPDLLGPVIPCTGSAYWTFAVPPNVQLIGANFYQQGLVYDPPINALGFTISNKGHGTIGLQ